LGIPVFCLEVCFGQYAGKGPLSIWGINPVAKGIDNQSLGYLLTIYTLVLFQVPSASFFSVILRVRLSFSIERASSAIV
jgi:hypothetical protein